MKDAMTLPFQVRDLVEKKAGISGQVLTDAQLAVLLNERMQIKKIAEPRTYLSLLKASPEEFQEILEKIVVPETWFFRDRAAFDFLIAQLSKTGPFPYRFLSVPCSSGEEPYSLAMALLEAGFAPEHFSIDALDVSERALEQAQQGVYKKKSFRTKDCAFRDRYFENSPDEKFVLKAIVKQSVRFQHGNLYSPSFFRSLSPARYQAIFCRNCLMYLHFEAQAKVLNDLGHLLISGGLLFVGPVEVRIASRHGFKLMHPYKAGACTL